MTQSVLLAYDAGVATLTFNRPQVMNALDAQMMIEFRAAAESGDIMGLVTLADLRKIPEADWDTVSIYRAMTPRNQLVTADVQTEPLKVLQLMAQHNINQVVMYDGTNPTGLLTRAALLQAIELRGEIAQHAA